MGFNINAIRNINKLKLQAKQSAVTQSGMVGHSDSSGIVTVFEAETNGGVSFDTQVNFSDPFSGQLSSAFTAVANLLGKAPAFDIPRKFLYKGSDPLGLDFNCFLRLKESPQKDYIEPISNLAKLMLPTRGEEDITKDINSAINSVGNTILDVLHAVLGTKTDQTNIDISKQLGKVYLLEVPFPYKAYEEDNNKLTLRIGAIRIPEIIVTRMGVKMPMFTYDKGYPDHINISLHIETLRPATENMLRSLFV